MCARRAETQVRKNLLDAHEPGLRAVAWIRRPDPCYLGGGLALGWFCVMRQGLGNVEIEAILCAGFDLHFLACLAVVFRWNAIL